MHCTRSLVGVLAKGPQSMAMASSTSRIILATQRIASLHTARALAEEKRGFLSRLNPFAKPAPEEPRPTPVEAAEAAEELKVEIEEEEEEVIPSWKSERKSLTPEQLEESIRSAAAPFVDTSSSVQLHRVRLEPKTKFQAISTGREIPSKDISSIHTLKDVFSTLQRLDQEALGLSANPKGHVVAEWFEKNKSTLPRNMVFIPYQKSKGIKVEDRRTTNKRFL
ncbi:hypothetical protein BGZ80_008883 [Entomortierella chlamydospora]|uniref:Uncharacterized protein n=1 Tax=Entomortierella chlamydospora TaxID=101097 RepID=A0A9P6MWV2_9FUNG|nr:hypothetical protein BGZ79_004718 [Entomortierella chlamydospora]KAG0016822.1 hypothetical protein BGZ80_008883 [Entomortierella chlamydospora]